jgi:hypothetical protein
LGALIAGFGFVSLVSAQLGYPITAEIGAAFTGFLGAIIALIAGNDSLAVKKGVAAQARLDAKP